MSKSQIALRREYVALGGSVRDMQLPESYDSLNSNLRQAYRNLAFVTDDLIKYQIVKNVLDMSSARQSRFEALAGQYGNSKAGFKRAYTQLLQEER